MRREDRPIAWGKGREQKRGEEGFGSSFYMFLSLDLSYVNGPARSVVGFT